MRVRFAFLSVSGLLVGGAAVAGCSAGPGSSLTPAQSSCSAYVQVTPTAATVDHAAQAPENQVQFQTASGERCTNGASRAVLALIYAAWTNPDPLDIQISSAADATNGTAICKNTTAGPVTLTASATLSGTVYQQSVQLTCR